MATIDAAAKVCGRKPNRIAAFMTVVSFAVGGLALGGCSSSGNLLESSLPQSNIATNSTAQPQAPAAGGPTVRVATVIGAPDEIAGQLAQQVGTRLAAKNVKVVTEENAASDFVLRGYMVAARERAGTKVSYIWDVTDPQGKRVNRVNGEEIIQGSNSRDPWVSVSPQIIGQIATKTADSLGKWLPTQRVQAQTPVAAVQPTSVTPGAAAPSATPTSVAARPLPIAPSGVAPTTTAAVPRTAPAATGRTTTGSLPRAGITVVRPNVAGAPGDGSTSLARALTTELTKNGVALSPAQTGTNYGVDAKVAMGSPIAGKQAIQIDWVVKDPAGKKIGTVSQKNEIPAGSLNGAWGQTASAAAGAAAQGILRLIREHKSPRQVSSAN
ncbi:MAG: hypothetical protein AAFR70_05045 [Pseudomonadota bacterium]